MSGDAEEETAQFVIVASHGGGLAATEVQVGLDLRLRGADQDVLDVHPFF